MAGIRASDKSFTVGLLLLAFAASAQIIKFTNSVQEFTKLTSTTGNLDGRCKLWRTATATLAALSFYPAEV